MGFKLLKMWENPYVIGSALVLFLAAGYAGMEVTMSSGFCGSCHIMKPYYEEWKHSSHKDVPCVKCHIEPGVNNLVKRKITAVHELVSVVTGQSPPRPHTNVRDVVCLRPGCHSVDTLIQKGPIEFGKSVKFDHSQHLDETVIGKLRCTSCHSQTVMGEHIGVNKEVCITCHFKMQEDLEVRAESDFCKTCHTIPQKELLVQNTDMTFSHADHFSPDSKVKCKHCHMDMASGKKGQVQEYHCKHCHKDPKIISQIKDVEMLHGVHIHKHKVDCYMCHEQINHSSHQQVHWNGKPDQCNHCHQESHTASALFYKGEGGRGVKGMPGTKAKLGVDCIGCHVEGATLKLKTSSKASVGCRNCHGNDGESYLDDIRAQIAQAESELAQLIKIAEKSAPNSTDLQDARFNLHFIRDAHGIHNPEYAQALIDHSKEKLQSVINSK